MLTRRGRFVLWMALLLLVAGRLLGVTELFGLAAAAVTVVVVGVLRVRSPNLKLVVSATVVPQVIEAGETAMLELTVENAGSVPTPRDRLFLVSSPRLGPEVHIPRLVPGDLATVSLRLSTERRGRHELPGLDAMVVDGLGAAQRKLTSTGRTRYGVRPPAEALPAVLPSSRSGSGLETTRASVERLRSGASLLRPYVPGDGLRRVHWPTTARLGDLIVREGGDRERDARPEVTLVLSQYVLAGRSPESAPARFEDAVRVVASLAVAAEQEGAFRLVVPGEIDSHMSSGPRHLDAVLDALIDVAATTASGSFDVRRAPVTLAPDGGVVVFVAACEDEKELDVLLGPDLAELRHHLEDPVAVCAGASESRIEVDRPGVVVRLALGGSLAELWSASGSSLVRP